MSKNYVTVTNSCIYAIISTEDNCERWSDLIQMCWDNGWEYQEHSNEDNTVEIWIYLYTENMDIAAICDFIERE